MNKSGLIVASRSDSGVTSTSVSESALSGSESGSRKSAEAAVGSGTGVQVNFKVLYKMEEYFLFFR